MGNNGKVLLALLGGAAAGVVLGLLFAPEKGADTRKKITDGATGLKDNLSDRYNSVKERINDRLNETRGSERYSESGGNGFSQESFGRY